MEILFFCTRWGSAHIPWDVFAAKVKAAGYDGIETDIPEDASERKTLLDALAENKLLLVAQHWETTERDFKKHIEQYKKKLELLASVEPLSINSHTGKDYFSIEENGKLIKLAEEISLRTSVPVTHETHRGRFSFAAHVTHQYLKQHKALSLTLDVSHWCAVAESFLDDQPEALMLAIERTKHIHARIGYTQGPQVTDPRLAIWNEALSFHLDCWEKIVAARIKDGTKQLLITPEFGPFPYMLTVSSSGEPVVDQWEINIYMKDLLTERFQPMLQRN